MDDFSERVIVVGGRGGRREQGGRREGGGGRALIGLVDGVVGCTLSGRAAFQSSPFPLGWSAVESHWGPVRSGRIGVQSSLVALESSRIWLK